MFPDTDNDEARDSTRARKAPAEFLRSTVFWGCALGATYLGILAARPGEAWFGVPGQWTWSGRPPSPATIPRWPPAIAALVLIVVVGLWLDGRWSALRRPGRLLALTGLALMIVAIQGLLLYVHFRYPMEGLLYRVIGPHNGFWQAAIGVESIREYLATYPEQMRATQGVFVHLPVHPPGDVLYLWMWRRFFELWPQLGHGIAQWLRVYNCADFGFVTLEDAQIASAVGQMVVPFLSSLTVFPLYWWSRQVAGDRTAWRTSLIFSLNPALSLFVIRWDTLYPLFAVAAFALLHRGLRTRATRWWFASGLAVSLASFLSFGNATLAPALAVYAALDLWLESPRARCADLVSRNWRNWVALVAGGYAVWGLYHVCTGVSVWEVFATTLETHLHLGRTYWPWVLYNLYDLTAFSGVASGVLFWVGAAGAVLAVARGRRPTAAVPYLAAVLVILVLNVSGVVRGEVGRMWLPWMPIVALAAAQGIRSRERNWELPVLTASLALQSLWMTLFLRVMVTGMPSYVPRNVDPAQQASVRLEATDAEHLGAVFGGNIRLAAYDLTVEQGPDGASAAVTLFWEAPSRPALPYSVFVHLVDAGGQVVAQHDGMPVNDELWTSCWQPAEQIRDIHRFPLSDTGRALAVGLYYWPTMERLAVTDPGTGDTIAPGALRIPFSIPTD